MSPNRNRNTVEDHQTSEGIRQLVEAHLKYGFSVELDIAIKNQAKRQTVKNNRMESIKQ